MESPGTSTGKMRIYSLREVVNDTSKPPPQIVGDGILLDGTLLMIYGSAKAGKSFLAANLGLAIAAKKDFAGFKIESSQRVLNLSAEGGYHPNRQRLRVMTRGMDRGHLDNFFVCFDSRLILTDAEDFAALDKVLTDLSPGVLVIDPLVRFHHAKENEAGEMARVFECIHRIKSDHDLSVILVHHTGKNGAAGPRGSSVISGEYDTGIELARGVNGHRLIFDTRHVEAPPDRFVKFDPNTLWFDVSDQDFVARIVAAKGGCQKRDLVQAIISEGSIKTPGGAYKAIQKSEEQGNIVVQDGLVLRKN